MALKSHVMLSLLILFASLSNVQGRIVGEIVRESDVLDVGPFVRIVESESAGAVEGHSKPKLPALLDGLEVQGGKIAPSFDPNIFNYTVELSSSIELLEIVAKVGLRAGDGDEKYKVKTKILGEEKEKISYDRHPHTRLQSKPEKVVDPSVVEIHVSASDREAVVYYFNVGEVADGPVRNPVWTVLFQILFWTGVVVAAAVVGVFGYALYLNYTAKCPDPDTNASNGGDSGDYRRLRRGEGSSGA